MVKRSAAMFCPGMAALDYATRVPPALTLRVGAVISGNALPFGSRLNFSLNSPIRSDATPDCDQLSSDGSGAMRRARTGTAGFP